MVCLEQVLYGHYKMLYMHPLPQLCDWILGALHLACWKAVAASYSHVTVICTVQKNGFTLMTMATTTNKKRHKIKSSNIGTLTCYQHKSHPIAVRNQGLPVLLKSAKLDLYIFSQIRYIILDEIICWLSYYSVCKYGCNVPPTRCRN